MGKNDKNLHYKNKSMRLSEKTWVRLQDKRKETDKSWNMLMVDLLMAFEKCYRRQIYEQRKNKNH